MLKVLSAAAAVSALAASISFADAIPSRTVYGNYIEARTADVYTGPCFANGEAEQVGREAVFGWKITNGDWHGVNLAGLAVVGVVRSEHTLGLASEPVNPAKAVLIVDSRANAEQRLALQSFARQMGGELLKDVVKVDYVPIDLTIQDNNIHGGATKLTAGSLASIQTRALNSGDHVCGNEEVWYPPLTAVEHVMPAYALDNSFTGEGLGETWHNRMRRSGFVGTFQVPAQ
ncbi:MAG TPA: DUF1326 domain-containing protein [Bryobacteraceae bacterium]|nr:DUF1326 domain-containing protein [Bryobacteraceae bacterium]